MRMVAMTDKPEVQRCAACGTEKPVSEMKTCMHAQMHRYVCDMKCMNDFYNPPPKQALEPAGSYQKGYDEGRHQGTKHRVADIQQLEAARAADKARIAELEAEKARCFIPEGVWHEGCPRHPYGSEWFIAKLDNGQRVVLKELPEEHSYDYRTADETYYSAYRIAAWMQFPDSQYVAALAQQGKESANGQ